MARPKKNAAKPEEVTASNGACQSLVDEPYAYLIRIPRREDRMRAIAAFLRVPRTYCAFADYQYLLTPEHVAALSAAAIPFEDITEPE